MLSNFSSFLAILRYWNSFECRQFMNFLWKRSQILLPGADYERKIHVAGLLGQRFLKENWKWRTKPVSGQINEEGNKKVFFFFEQLLSNFFHKQQLSIFLRNFMRNYGKLLDCKTVRTFAHSSTREQSNKRFGTRLKTESETGERR